MKNNKKKILIIRLGAIGDVVHSSIIQQSIMNKYPEAEIHYLTSELCEPIVKNDSNISKVHVFNTKLKDNIFYILKLSFFLKKEKFDVVFNLSNSLRNKIISALVSSKKIVSRNKLGPHAVDSFFNTAKSVYEELEKPESLNLQVCSDAKDKIENIVKNYPRPFIVISPGGQNDKNREGRIWSLDNWIKLSNELVNKHGGTIFVAGSKEERELHEGLSTINSSVIFSGDFSLAESAALFNIADLFISGDSGPLHMASALGVKTLGLMGSTKSVSCGPYGKKCYSIDSTSCNINCSKICTIDVENIYKPCMLSITPELVLQFIEDNNLL